MATSGITIFELSRDSLIKAAMRKLGVLAKGQSPDSEDLTNGMLALNSTISELQGQGLLIWKRNEVSVTLTANRTYNIGISQTVNVPFPLRVESAWLVTTATGQRQELEIKGRAEFSRLNALSTGSPTAISYQPKVNLGVLSVWPIPDSTTQSTKTILLSCRTAIEGFTGATETPDLPQEWQNVLIYGTAVSLAPEYGVPLNDRNMLIKEYQMHLDLATTATQGEDESIFFQVDTNGV
jgi:hypothetical protein